MSYRLDFDDDIATTVRRCAPEQLDDAVRNIAARGDGDPAEAIHEARKDIKKTRSLLRLVRPALGADAYRRRNVALRDIGRGLSAQRDVDAIAETMDDLAERFAGQLPHERFVAARERLAAAATTAPDLDAALAALRQAADDVASWPLERCDRSTLQKGMVRAYARGRTAMATAETDPSDQAFHDWRKRAKDLWYHSRLMSAAWPEVLKPQAKQAHALADLLGDDHDLAVLSARLTADGPEERELRSLVARRRGGLQAEALRLGRRLYAETPKAFGRRMGRYLAEAQRDPQPA
jgi:CHAD domain-containing protein